MGMLHVSKPSEVTSADEDGRTLHECLAMLSNPTRNIGEYLSLF
jgi:hypothetical protein